MAPVNGLNSDSFMDIAMFVAGTSYYGYQDGPRASYCFSEGVIGVLHCIMAASCMQNFLIAIFLIKTGK